MHRLPSKSSVIRFRAAAVMLVCSFALGAAGLVILGKGILKEDPKAILPGVFLGGGAVGLFVLQWLVANRARCPLCTIPPLVRKGCQKSRQAKRLFGSYRLQVAASILLRGSFQCPNFGEATKLRVRDRSVGGVDRSLMETESSHLR